MTRSITQPISASASSSASAAELRPGRERQQAFARAGPARAVSAPQLLGEERHERVQELEDHVAHPGRHRPRLGLGRAVRAGQHGLDQFEIPVAEDVPDEAVDRVRRLVEPVGFDRLR